MHASCTSDSSLCLVPPQITSAVLVNASSKVEAGTWVFERPGADAIPSGVIRKSTKYVFYDRPICTETKVCPLSPVATSCVQLLARAANVACTGP